MNVQSQPWPRFQERTVLVVGAGSRGEAWSNGKAAAMAYAREGASVVCVDLDAEAAAETAGCIAREGGTAEAVTADVTDTDSVEGAVEHAVRRFSQIDILHNNVGVTHMGGPVELNEHDFDRSIALNLGSVYRTCRAVLPHMLRRGSGAIVNISSLASIRWTGYPYFAYCAAKAAVNQATVAIAMQYARQGIRANCVIPGAIDTPLVHRQIASQYTSTDEMVRERARMVPLGRMGDAWDVAQAALFLASDQARFITGVCLPVDGGQSCQTQPLS